MIDSEVTELEAELAELEAAVEAGTLSPEAAAEAQVRISARLESIVNAVETDAKATLTDAQRSQLSAGLERLKNTLVQYQSTLVAIDTSVAQLDEAARPVLRRGGRAVRNISTAAMETVDDIQETAEDILEDYVIEPAAELLDEIASSTDMMVDESEAEMSNEPEMDDGSTDDSVIDEEIDMDSEPVIEEPTETSDVGTVKEFTLDSFSYGYSETEIRVKQGDTVTINLTNSGGFHDWVVDEFEAATDKISEGETTSVTFVADQVGTFEYYCSVGSHREQGMVGSLVVE